VTDADAIDRRVAEVIADLYHGHIGQKLLDDLDAAVQRAKANLKLGREIHDAHIR
jgi:hypothetical protein